MKHLSKQAMILCLLLFISARLKADIVILEDFRDKTLREGQSNVYLSVEDQNYRQVSVYYRVSGTDLFVPHVLTKKSDKWLWTLSASQIWSPGIDYYFEVALPNGDRETLPKEFPVYNPLSIDVKSKKDIRLTFESISDRWLNLYFEGVYDEGSRILVGDIDVTDFVIKKGNQLRIDVSAFEKKDLFSVTLQSSSGERLTSLTLPELENASDGRAHGDHYVKIGGDASLSIGVQETWEDEKRDPSLTGNLGLGAEYRNGEFVSTLEGFNANYQHGAEEEVKLGTGYLLTMKYRDTGIELGDVTTQGTSLVMSGFSRRGMRASSEGESWKGEVFNVRTSPIDSWESGISFDDRQTYGASYQHQLGEDGKTSVHVSMVSGKLKNDDDAENVGSTTQSEQSGNSVGVQVTTELSGFGIDAQVADSKFDGDTSDDVDADRDQAYELSLSKDIYGLASSVGYQRYGANYATIANPNFSGDRAGYDLSVGSAWKDLSWQASFSTTRDNIEDDADRAIVTSNNYGINTSYNRKLWPSLNLGYNISQQSSSEEPSVEDEIDNNGYDLNAGLSDSFGLLNWSINSSFGHIEDKLDSLNDSNTSSHGVSLSRSFSNGDVSLNLSRNKQWSDITTRSDLLNLAMNIPLFSEKFMLNTQFSGQTNRASDDSVDTVIIGGSAKLAWSLQDIVSIRGFEWANPQFSLTWISNRHKDRNNLSNITDENSWVLEFSMGAPYQFENTWFLNDSVIENDKRAER